MMTMKAEDYCQPFLEFIGEQQSVQIDADALRKDIARLDDMINHVPASVLKQEDEVIFESLKASFADMLKKSTEFRIEYSGLTASSLMVCRHDTLPYDLKLEKLRKAYFESKKDGECRMIELLIAQRALLQTIRDTAMLSHRMAVAMNTPYYKNLACCAPWKMYIGGGCFVAGSLLLALPVTIVVDKMTAAYLMGVGTALAVPGAVTALSGCYDAMNSKNTLNCVVDLISNIDKTVKEMRIAANENLESTGAAYHGFELYEMMTVEDVGRMCDTFQTLWDVIDSALELSSSESLASLLRIMDEPNAVGDSALVGITIGVVTGHFDMSLLSYIGSLISRDVEPHYHQL